MSLMRRGFPSFGGSAHVSPYLYVAPKRRWWPTLLTFAAGGACALALLGPSQKPAGVAGAEKPERPLVLQVRPGDAVSARDLANPPAVAIESSGDPPAQSIASAGESHGSVSPGTLQQPSAEAPASAMASVEYASPPIPPETRIIATPARPPVVAKRYAAQSAVKSSAHRHVAKKSRRHEDGYAYDYAGYRRYRFAGERAYGGYWGAPSGYYGQRGGWFSGVN
jgi:hypothetical protein